MVRRGRQAFTLIEILVVVGIILILISIGVIGFQHIDKAASEKATRTTFATCSAVLSEYEASVANLNLIEGAGPTGTPPSIYTSTSGLTATQITTLATTQYTNPGDVNVGGSGRGATAVATTGTIFQICGHVPACKTELAQLPASVLLPGTTPTNPVILDAWKNPIIYVPASGLPNVMVFVGTTQARTVIVTAVDGRPFWASAGPDGNFTNGDDNVYSSPVAIH